jgi:transcriptional regulator GlxA family with amidase domain
MVNVGVFIYDKAEELDFVGPFEVFQAAGQFAADRGLDGTTVFTVARTTDPIATAGGLRVLPHHSIDDHPRIDLLVVPGGDSRGPVEDPDVIAWVSRVASGAKLTTSVCTGAYVLGKAGLLAGRKATTHWMSLDRMVATHPDTEVVRNVRWVDEGDIVTGAGVSAGIDMALHVVERLYGREVAEETAGYMEYHWNENPSRA